MRPVAAWIAALLLAVLLTAPSQAAQPRLIGGQPVPEPGSAPYSVLILAGSGSSSALCSGSIIDATHVLTAAHCTRNEQGQQYPAGSMLIEIGTTNDNADDGLIGLVRGVRGHPAYDPATGLADVAVLQVPPIRMGTTIAAVPMVAAGAAAPDAGTVVRANGWGGSAPDGSIDFLERSLDLTLGAPTDCWSGVAAAGCARSATGGPCPGDSGGAVLRDGVQIGVIDTRHGIDCAAGSQLGFVDLSAPGIAQFVAGNDSPPALPSTTAPATLVPPPLTGGAATCTAPAWANAASTTTVFFHRDSGAVVQEGPATTYVPQATDAGHELGCRSVAQAAGGSASAPAATGISVLAARLAVRAAGTGATVSYSGATGLRLAATLTKAGHEVWSKSLTGPRLTLPRERPGSYKLCIDAPAAGQFAAVQACAPWRAPKRRS